MIFSFILNSTNITECVLNYKTLAEIPDFNSNNIYINFLNITDEVFFRVSESESISRNLGGSYRLSGNKDYKSTLKISWSGYRFSIGLEYYVIW